MDTLSITEIASFALFQNISWLSINSKNKFINCRMDLHFGQGPWVEYQSLQVIPNLPLALAVETDNSPGRNKGAGGGGRPSTAGRPRPIYFTGVL